MKRLFIVFSIITGSVLTAWSEDVEAPNKVEVTNVSKIHRNLLVLGKNPNNISNIYSAVNLLSMSDDPYNLDELKTLEELVPSIAYILNRHDEKITPILLSQSLKSDNIYFKRRAIFCVERICGSSIAEILMKRFGENGSSGRLADLLEATSVVEGGREMSWYFPPFGSTLDDALENITK